MNKFNIGDKVLYEKEYNYTVLDKDQRTDGWYYDVEYKEGKFHNRMWTHEQYLTPYIEEEHKPVGSGNVLEGDTQGDITDLGIDPLGILRKSKIDISPQKLLLKEEAVGLDYEKEYYKSMTKHSELQDTIELQEEIIFNMVLINQKKYD